MQNLDSLPPHVVQIVRPQEERQYPERGQQRRQAAGDQQPWHRIPSTLRQSNDHQQERRCEQEERWKQVGQPGERNEHRCPSSVLARPCTADDEPEGNERKAERDRCCELTRQCRRDVAPIDVERAVERERQTRERKHRWSRKAQSTEMAQRPCGNREHDDATHGDELERDVVGQSDQQWGDDHDRDHQPPRQLQLADRPAVDGGAENRQDDRNRQDRVEPDIENDDQQRWNHHVEMKRREARVPVGGPARETQSWQQFITQERGTPHVRAHVPTSGRRVREDEVGVQLPEDEQRAPDDHERGHHALDQVRPLGLGPRGVGRHH